MWACERKGTPTKAENLLETAEIKGGKFYAINQV
jgi:hypothetical protein